MICDCADRIGIEISTYSLFEQLKAFFNNQVKQDVFAEVKPKEPYYVWESENRKVEHYATKWYRCTVCGCLWEFEYPDFPACGFVRKYQNGVYTGTKRINT